MERFAKISGMKIKYVAYKGSSPSIRALMGGEINMAAGSAMASTAAVNTGKVRAIANFGTERIPALPDLPTIGEQGFPGFVMDNSYILWVRSGTPRTIINHLNKVVSSGLNTPEYTKLLVASGSEPGKPMTPEQLKKEVAKDYAEIVETVKDLGLKF
jgi:tripartite-type tricarboxylate transporter receptor subunit TctC